jgi:HK97 family phage major capsid protein
MDIKEEMAKIDTRNSEIDKSIAAETDVEKIKALRSEKDTNLENRGKLLGEQEAETKLRAEAAAEEGKKKEVKKAMLSLNKKQARNLLIGSVFKGVALTEEERAAVMDSLTTTADTYVAPTTTTAGVNNGGVFISKSVIADLLSEYTAKTSILNDVVMTNVPGLVVFPYRKTRSVATAKAEGATVPAAAYEWANLEGKKGFLTLNVRLTDEVLALSSIALGNYIAIEIAKDLTEDWSGEVIYGTGADDRISGITATAIAKTYTAGKELAGITAGLKALGKKYSNGAVIYVAHDLYLSLLTALDTNGRPIFDAFNSNAGIASMFGYTVKEDTTLNDGDFVIGNVSMYYKLNELIPLTTESDRHAASHYTDVIASVYCAGAAVPAAFVYGKVGA